MTRGVRKFLVGSVVLVVLAGCGRTILQYAQREPWRAQAEAACMSSGAVREKAGLVRISPIEGPGVCGAEQPLKVALLGDGSTLGFADEPIRPPGSIPGASQPRWPIAAPRAAPQVPYRDPNPSQSLGVLRHPAPYGAPRDLGAPLSIHPPGLDPPQAAAPHRSPPPGAPDDEFDDEEMLRLPQQRRPAPVRTVPALGPQRAPQVLAAAAPVEVKPAATLACPIVSALDRWVAESVQPAARKWFRQPVVEIRQISAYSCRGMNGQPGARISEHAFGNALDIAAFVLQDGTRITVKNGWRGSPEEQGFLRDVQGAACDQFTTVLAPGSNRFHYDHFHFDLMRRASGRRICNPGAVDGEAVAARARGGATAVARARSAPPVADPPPLRRYDPPFDERNDPFAWRGDSARRGDPSTTGSIDRSAARRPNAAAEDDDWVEDEGPRPAIDWAIKRHAPQ